MKNSVTYTLLGPDTVLRETVTETGTKTETLPQIKVPFQVQRELGMPQRSLEPDPCFDGMTSAEVYKGLS